MCVCERERVCVNVCTCMCVCVHVHVCVCVYMYVCMCVLLFRHCWFVSIQIQVLYVSLYTRVKKKKLAKKKRGKAYSDRDMNQLGLYMNHGPAMAYKFPEDFGAIGCRVYIGL